MSTAKPTIATLGSHSALEVCRGAHKHGFKTLVITQRGRNKTYDYYFKSVGEEGCVDDTILLEKFDEVLKPQIQQQLTDTTAIFIPNRSFEVYVHNDYDAIENNWQVPMFGNKFLLRMEERTGKLTQYNVLAEAKIRTPKVFTDYKKIDRLCIIKAQQKVRSFERAFFFASTPAEFEREYEQRIAVNLISDSDKLRIEEYVIGAQINLNFFYSPITQKLQLIGTDTRRQTNVTGLVSLPTKFQNALPQSFNPIFEEAGHIATTILESMLEPAFELGEKFITAAKTFHPRGVIGPFSLQSMIVPTTSGKEFVVFDVSPRMPGSPGIEATPYSSYYYGQPMSMGERVALEIKTALNENSLNLITT